MAWGNVWKSDRKSWASAGSGTSGQQGPQGGQSWMDEFGSWAQGDLNTQKSDGSSFTGGSSGGDSMGWPMVAATVISAISGGLAAYAGRPPESESDRYLKEQVQRFRMLGGQRAKQQFSRGPGTIGKRHDDMRKRVIELLANPQAADEKSQTKMNLRRDSLRGMMSPGRRETLRGQS
tara:strand:+ start:3241 stop:3771 length:531 start_codon:yes stop_codon:yes gene_type:complete